MSCSSVVHDSLFFHRSAFTLSPLLMASHSIGRSRWGRGEETVCVCVCVCVDLLYHFARLVPNRYCRTNNDSQNTNFNFQLCYCYTHVHVHATYITHCSSSRVANWNLSTATQTIATAVLAKWKDTHSP